MSDEQPTEHQARFKKLQEPFPEGAYKELSFGGYKMTTIDAYHIVERMTDVFGLCGTAWGFGELEFQQHGDNVACIGYIWYRLSASNDAAKHVHAVGDAVVRNGNVAEAYKKAQTNLLSKASSFIGIGLDVYKGIHQDDPYKERAEAIPPQPAATPAPAETAPVGTPAPAAVNPVDGDQTTIVPADGSMPICRPCGTNESVIRGKEEYGGGYVCWKNHTTRPGCGNKDF